MSDVGAMVARLIEAGCSPDVAASVVAEVFIAGVASADVRGHSADLSAERRREKDRLRKAAKRGIPQNSADVRGIPQNSENASLSIESKKEEVKEEKRPRNESVRGHRLPDDWHPSAPDTAIAHQLLGPPRTATELEKFRDHWKQQPGSKGVKLDWNAAWRNWIRRAADYLPGGVNGRRKTVHDAARELHENLVARVLAFDEPAPSGLCEREGEDVVRLLPARRRE